MDELSSLHRLYEACERERHAAVVELDDALAMIATRDETIKALRREVELPRLRVEDLT